VIDEELDALRRRAAEVILEIAPHLCGYCAAWPGALSPGDPTWWSTHPLPGASWRCVRCGTHRPQKRTDRRHPAPGWRALVPPIEPENRKPRRQSPEEWAVPRAAPQGDWSPVTGRWVYPPEEW